MTLLLCASSSVVERDNFLLKECIECRYDTELQPGNECITVDIFYGISYEFGGKREIYISIAFIPFAGNTLYNEVFCLDDTLLERRKNVLLYVRRSRFSALVTRLQRCRKWMLKMY